MKNSKRILKILLPSILCAVVIYITDMSIEYYPLSFGLIIGFVNWNFHKYKPLIGVSLSVLASYISFSIAYFSLGIFGYTRDMILANTDYAISDDLIGTLAFIISTSVIAPLLVFYLYRFIFTIQKTTFSKVIILISIVLLGLIQYGASVFYETFNSYLLWQVIMALAIQLLINQKINKKVL